MCIYNLYGSCSCTCIAIATTYFTVNSRISDTQLLDYVYKQKFNNLIPDATPVTIRLHTAIIA